MSLPTYVYECTGCSFTQTMWNYPIRYVYSYKDSYFNIPRATSWCYKCNMIVPSENFLNDVKFDSEYQLSNSDKMFIIKRIASLRKSPPRCLECGSTRITRIEEVNSKEEVQNKGSALHPKCGGYLYYTEEDDDEFRVVINYNNPIIRMYNIKGRYIQEQ